MSASSPQLSPEPRIDTRISNSMQQDSVLARLLHALNQPLTGLQCSLELALAVPREADQYAQTIREGLEFTQRVRELVDALREAIETREGMVRFNQSLSLHDLLIELVDELQPIAASRKVRMTLDCPSTVAVAGDRRFFLGLLFRLVESTLGLTKEGGQLRIACTEYRDQTQLAIEWDGGPRNRKFEFCHAELGLLLAQTGCEQSGGRWERGCRGERDFCALWLPRVLTNPERDGAEETR
jgi:signal transduction histidine kinase